ncbi:MAG TPA: YbdD/YjiX family protein [Croceibacterium sp.]|nr:YbdD/YjiX family protein [Croceibacterium sp.]
MRRGLKAQLTHAGQMLVGMPSYDTYLAHMAKHHPGGATMSYREFFNNRQAARFGGGGKGGFRCC